jgi:hypothetical protein
MGLLRSLVGTQLEVKTEDCSCSGKLVRVEEGDPRQHIPLVLILRRSDGAWMILRSWDIIVIS